MPGGKVGYTSWNCQRLIGVSPCTVVLVNAKILIESRVMSPTTRIGCCLITA